MITYPLNNIDYTAEDAELYFSTRESGVYDGNDFEVTASGIDNDVIVSSGIAWIHNTKFSGKVVALKEPKTLTLSLPNSVYDRIDAIVVQFDANKNATEIIVKEGIASSSPIAPTVVRTESLYELHIFHVQRKAGATVISIDDLVDLRNNSDYCGIMFDPISSIDSTLTKSGYAADAEETGKQIKRAINANNLLDNGDFMQFVAQAGIGGKHGTQDYAGDRWILDNGAVTGEVNANGNGYKNITLNGTIRQKVATPVDVASAFVEMVSGTATIAYQNGEVTITSNGGVLRRAMLFVGEYAEGARPAFAPKGYGAELSECQRYYLPIKQESSAYGYIDSDGKAFWLTIPTPVTMRTTPTFVLGGLQARMVGGPSNIGTVTCLGVYKMSNNVLVVLSQSVTNLSYGTPAVCYFTGNTYLSADL